MTVQSIRMLSAWRCVNCGADVASEEWHDCPASATPTVADLPARLLALEKEAEAFHRMHESALTIAERQEAQLGVLLGRVRELGEMLNRVGRRLSALEAEKAQDDALEEQNGIILARLRELAQAVAVLADGCEGLEKRERLMFAWVAEATTLLHATLQGDSVEREDLSRLLGCAQAAAVGMEGNSDG